MFPAVPLALSPDLYQEVMTASAAAPLPSVPEARASAISAIGRSLLVTTDDVDLSFESSSAATGSHAISKTVAGMNVSFRFCDKGDKKIVYRTYERWATLPLGVMLKSRPIMPSADLMNWESGLSSDEDDTSTTSSDTKRRRTHEEESFSRTSKTASSLSLREASRHKEVPPVAAASGAGPAPVGLKSSTGVSGVKRLRASKAPEPTIDFNGPYENKAGHLLEVKYKSNKWKLSSSYQLIAELNARVISYDTNEGVLSSSEREALPLAWVLGAGDLEVWPSLMSRPLTTTSTEKWGLGGYVKLLIHLAFHTLMKGTEALDCAFLAKNLSTNEEQVIKAVSNLRATYKLSDKPYTPEEVLHFIREAQKL